MMFKCFVMVKNFKLFFFHEANSLVILKFKNRNFEMFKKLTWQIGIL